MFCIYVHTCVCIYNISFGVQSLKWLTANECESASSSGRRKGRAAAAIAALGAPIWLMAIWFTMKSQRKQKPMAGKAVNGNLATLSRLVNKVIRCYKNVNGEWLSMKVGPQIQ